MIDLFPTNNSIIKIGYTLMQKTILIDCDIKIFTKNAFRVNHKGLTITLKNPISDLAMMYILSKSFKKGVYGMPNLPSSSY